MLLRNLVLERICFISPSLLGFQVGTLFTEETDATHLTMETNQSFIFQDPLCYFKLYQNLHIQWQNNLMNVLN